MNAARPSDPAERPMPSPRISPLDHGSNAAALCRPQAKGCSVAQRHSLSPGIAVHQRGAQRRNREGRDRPRQKNAAESDSDRKYARERLPRHEITITEREAGDEGEIDRIPDRPTLEEANQAAKPELDHQNRRHDRPADKEGTAECGQDASPNASSRR